MNGGLESMMLKFSARKEWARVGSRGTSQSVKHQFQITIFRAAGVVGFED